MGYINVCRKRRIENTDLIAKEREAKRVYAENHRSLGKGTALKQKGPRHRTLLDMKPKLLESLV